MIGPRDLVARALDRLSEWCFCAAGRLRGVSAERVEAAREALGPPAEQAGPGSPDDLFFALGGEGEPACRVLRPASWATIARPFRGLARVRVCLDGEWCFEISARDAEHMARMLSESAAMARAGALIQAERN